MSVTLSFERDIKFGDAHYPFHVHSGQESLVEFRQRMTDLDADIFVIITDNGVPADVISTTTACLNSVGRTIVHSIPNSESSKSLDVLNGLAEQVLQAGVTRNSVVVALGGGLVGNIAGLLAALMFRGIRLVHLPTTLLGMSDSVLSLKQAVNSRVGKNHLGTFYAPILVWNHLDFLDALPLAEIRSALCEMIKNVLAICPDQYHRVARSLRPDARYSPQNLMEFIVLCVDAKTSVMRTDQYEKSEALALEYGHTVGHAAELLTGGRLRHGYAIGVGMLVAARVACLLGIMDRADEQAHRLLLERNGSPTMLPTKLTAAELLWVIRRDNKRGYVPSRSGYADMILLEGLGKPHWVDDNIITQVEEDLLRESIAAFLPEGNTSMGITEAAA